MSTPISPISSDSSRNPAFAVGQLLDEFTLGNYVSAQKADASQQIKEEQRRRETATTQPSGTTTPQQRSYETTQSIAPASGNAPSGNIPQNLPLGLREQLVENAVRRFVNGQETDASPRLPGNRTEQEGLVGRQSLQGQIPGTQNPVQIPSSTINGKIAVNRA